MPAEFFICPMIRPDNPTPEDPVRPKYWVFPNSSAGQVMFSVHDECILGIDTAQANLDTINADPDVDRICAFADLDNVLTAGQRTAVQNALEARNIPAQWVIAGITWREVIRTVAGMFWLNKKITQSTFVKTLISDLHTWLQNGGLSNVAGYESEPPATTKRELNRQATIVSGLEYQELPTGVQNYLLAVRDEQGWTNQELGLTATSTVAEIRKSFDRQPKGIKRRLVRHGLNLDSTWSELPQGMKDELRIAVEDFGFDPLALGFTGSTTLRVMLKTFADEFALKEINFNGVVV